MLKTHLLDSDQVFRLKRDGTNLEILEYAEHLKSYLGTARMTKTISLNDLSNVI